MKSVIQDAIWFFCSGIVIGATLIMGLLVDMGTMSKVISWIMFGIFVITAYIHYSELKTSLLSLKAGNEDSSGK